MRSQQTVVFRFDVSQTHDLQAKIGGSRESIDPLSYLGRMESCVQSELEEAFRQPQGGDQERQGQGYLQGGQ